MHDQKPIPLPSPCPQRFENGIKHPDLWLWDSWTTESGGTLHLYSLALSRVDTTGASTSPETRNDYPFHIRHFTSTDDGKSWADAGVFLAPQDTADGAFARNVWSGSILARKEGGWVCGFTGIRELDASRSFLQTICLGRSSDGKGLDDIPKAALSCPIRDYGEIRRAGYYLPPKEALGSADGEEGGPILSWRDPYVLESGPGRFELFWSAKTAPARGAVAHATVIEDASGFRIEALHPPMTLPDDNEFTQAEVPKLYHDERTGTWYLLISACDRLSENQPADEVTKNLRLYRAASMRGPWKPAFDAGQSVVPKTQHLFGASVIAADFETGQLTLIAPVTEYAPAAQQLTFAAPVVVDLANKTADMIGGRPPQSF